MFALTIERKVARLVIDLRGKRRYAESAVGERIGGHDMDVYAVAS